MSPRPASPPAIPDRVHAMDGLRAFAMLLGILLHAAMPFMTFDVPWDVRHRGRHLIFDAFVGAVHPFRMQLFFLIAGFFADMLYRRLGPAGFIRHRFKRIFIPFVAGMIIIAPLTLRLLSSHLGQFAPLHLWFLEYLLIYYVAALAVVHLMRSDGGQRCLSRFDSWFATLAGSKWKPLVLAGPLAAIMWFSPMWADVDGGAGKSLVPGVRGLIYYGLFFSFGWLLHRQPCRLADIEKHVWSYLGWATVAFLAMGGLLFLESHKAIPYYAWIKLACLIAGAVYTWLMVFGTMGFFLRYLNRPSPAARYIADSSYWLYLAHLPVVIFLQIQLVKLNWSAFVTFGAINFIALALLYVSYHFLVRYTFIGTTLNGPRAPALGS
ncbi:MAG: acyltransferase family protein [Verrucomicrobia bacterium]|nr:acyltransferase family protein [Verrucomicrobiota bacterium]